MGLLGSLFIFVTQLFPPKSEFTVDDIPDLSGKVVVVTGANCGVGFETAKVCDRMSDGSPI
jgi:retinol dehydrogenase 12